MKIINKKGFTLIELLIVISIIAVLSSIVLASMPGVRDNARLAAGRTFSDHNYHAFLADNSLAYYNFDDNSDLTKAKDISGNGFDLSLPSNGSITFNNTLTPNKSKNSLPIGGTVTLNRTNLSGKVGPNLTISGWVYLSSLVQDGSGVSILRLINSPTVINYSNLYGLGLMVYGSVVRLDSFYDKSDGNYGQTVYNTNIATGKWYHVAVTYKSTSAVNDNTDILLYLNGSQVFGASNIQIPNTSKTVGIISMGTQTSASTISATNILVDDVAVYTTSLLASDIQKLYAQGLPAHTLAENK